MARADSEKCRIRSKLSTQEAQDRHGETGDSRWDGKAERCWEDQRCHNRRSYYRHRGARNHNRKQKRRGEQVIAGTGSTAILDIPVPAVPAAVIHWYRETKDAPLHAIGAELWMGNDRVAKIEPVHCLGLTELQVKTLLLRILDGFSQHVGMKVERFRSSVELHPQNCPIRLCPLSPE
jgi:hypothetical protein